MVISPFWFFPGYTRDDHFEAYSRRNPFDPPQLGRAIYDNSYVPLVTMITILRSPEFSLGLGLEHRESEEKTPPFPLNLDTSSRRT
jgi:hypothetical protein